jgi:rod shape-determining protein MreC
MARNAELSPAETGKTARGRGRAEVYVFIGLSLVSFATLLFSVRSDVSDFRNAGLPAYTGIRGSIYAASSFFARTADAVKELEKLNKENADLRKSISSFEQLQRNAADLRQENERLRGQLGFAETLRYRYIAAAVTGFDPENLFTAFSVNKGTRHGVAVNMPVVAYQDGAEILVGKVVEAAPLESLVMPLYDSACYISARLKQSRFEGIVEGQGRPDSPLLMRFVRGRVRGEIDAGETVVSSGLGGVYPEGLTIGTVEAVEDEAQVEIEIAIGADFSRLEYIFIIDAHGDARSGTEGAVRANSPEGEGDG